MVLGLKLDQHSACCDGDHVNDFTAAHRHQLIDHIDRHADMIWDDADNIANRRLVVAFGKIEKPVFFGKFMDARFGCLLYTSPSPRD